MSSNSETGKEYPENPTHGDVHEGEVYAEPLGDWLSQAEFDSLYSPRSQYMYMKDW